MPILNLRIPGYTIVVPANVRIRGVDMQLDLKIDQKTLAAASDISRAINEVVSSVSSLPADSGRQAILRIPSLNSDLNFTIAPDTPEGSSRGTASISLPSSEDLEAQSRQVSSTSHTTLMDDADGLDPKTHVVSSTTEPSPMEECTESGNIDDIQPCHGPTSTTEPMEQDTDDLVVSSSDNLMENLPNTSTPESQPSAKISVGTSFPETAGTYVEPTTSLALDPNGSLPPQTQILSDSNDDGMGNHSDAHNESLDHESQPTTSSTVPTTPVPHTPNAAAPKKKKGKSQAQSVVCEYVDPERGQVIENIL